MFHPGIMMPIDQIGWRGHHLPDGKINHVQTAPVYQREEEREREIPECSFGYGSIPIDTFLVG